MILDNELIFKGSFGLERETLRVTSDGFLAQTPHPFCNKLITRDFCENQIELVSPVCSDIDELFEEISTLDKSVRSTLVQNGEYLWLNSNPPHFETEDDIPIANFKGNEIEKRVYRERLATRYGKRLMLYSGIHFNFSFCEEYLNSICTGGENLHEFKNKFYFKLFKQICKHSWLLVLLTAASPVYDLSLDGDFLYGSSFSGYASMRNGHNGYWNNFTPTFDCINLHTYIQSIEQYVNTGALFSEWELYVPVRLKPNGYNSIKNLKENGINHIELRMFDVNPLSSIGIFIEDIKFAHYLLIYLSHLDDFDFTEALQKQAISNHKAAAIYDLAKIKTDNLPAYDCALNILESMSIFFKSFPDILDVIEYQKNKLTNHNRYCEIIHKKLSNDFHKNMLKITKSYTV